jgi:hypothetical protein
MRNTLIVFKKPQFIFFLTRVAVGCFKSCGDLLPRTAVLEDSVVTSEQTDFRYNGMEFARLALLKTAANLLKRLATLVNNR